MIEFMVALAHKHQQWGFFGLKTRDLSPLDFEGHSSGRGKFKGKEGKEAPGLECVLGFLLLV